MLEIVLTILVFYTAYCCTLYLTQRKIMFPTYMMAGWGQEEIDIPGVEKIWLDTSSGRIETWFMPPDSSKIKGPWPAVIFAHGNAELMDSWHGPLDEFNRMGIAVLLVEYPGYGRSEGSPSQASITEAFVKAYDTISARDDVDGEKIIPFGISIGGGAACALAEERPTPALILMSTFTSARSFASRYFAPGFLVRDPFDNQKVVKSYPHPILIMHGKVDDIIPYSHGVALHETAKNSRLVTYDCGHNNCPPRWRVFWEDIRTFLVQANIIQG